MQHPSLPLLFFGFLILLAGLLPTVMIVNIRVFQRKGMTMGGAGWRRGEPAADYQRRAKRLDTSTLAKARRLRPRGLVVAAAGLAMIVAGFIV